MLPINEMLENKDEQIHLVQSLDALLESRQLLMNELVKAKDVEKLCCLQQEISSDIQDLKKELMRMRDTLSNISNLQQYSRIEDECQSVSKIAPPPDNNSGACESPSGNGAIGL